MVVDQVQGGLRRPSLCDSRLSNLPPFHLSRPPFSQSIRPCDCADDDKSAICNLRKCVVKSLQMHDTLIQGISHLKKLEKSSKNLKLFKADLLDYDSLRAAIEGCHEVFPVASPVPSTTVLNPEVEVIEPAVKGTLNVFKASLEVKIKRVVPLLLLCPSILGGLKVKCWMRLVGGMRA